MLYFFYLLQWWKLQSTIIQFMQVPIYIMYGQLSLDNWCLHSLRPSLNWCPIFGSARLPRMSLYAVDFPSLKLRGRFLMNTFGMNCNADCAPGLFTRYQCVTLLKLLWWALWLGTDAHSHLPNLVENLPWRVEAVTAAKKDQLNFNVHFGKECSASTYGYEGQVCTCC